MHGRTGHGLACPDAAASSNDSRDTGTPGHWRDGGFGAGHSIPRPALAYNMRRLVWMTESAAPA
jgi:hypothetical protein